MPKYAEIESLQAVTHSFIKYELFSLFSISIN